MAKKLHGFVDILLTLTDTQTQKYLQTHGPEYVIRVCNQRFMSTAADIIVNIIV